MRRLNERKLVVVLFVLVLITFAFAQNDTSKMERVYQGVSKATTPTLQTIAQVAGENKSALLH